MKPLITYWSSSSRGTQRIAEALNTPTVRIEDAGDINQPFILMTPTYDQPRGKFTPRQVQNFLGWHADKMIGVISTGNRNFGENYCAAGKEISTAHNVPLLWRVDIMGSEHDYTTIDAGIEQHWDTLLNMRGL